MNVESTAKNNRYIDFILTAGLIVGAGVAIVNGYNTYMTNFWRPSVTVGDVDWANAVCQLTINGDAVTLYGNSIVSAGGTWGVQFGTTGVNDEVYDTVVLINNGMVYSVLKINDTELPPADTTTVATT